MFNKLFTHFTRVILSACIIAMMAVTPGFAANSVSITFDLAGGVLPDGSTSYTYESDGTNMVVLDNPTKDGFIFRGWCTQAAIDGNQCVPEYISDESDGAFVRWIIPATVAANTTYVAQWTPDEFQITTTNLSSDIGVGFILTAAGQFYVDWGDGDVEYIERATVDVENVLYTHTYEEGGVYTIHFGGLATEYRYLDPNDPEPQYSMMDMAAINFGMGKLPGVASLSAYIASVSGSLGAIFPTLNNGANLSDNPAFIGTFAVSPYLRSVPADLFSGVTKASAAMFAMTFGILDTESGDTEEGLCGLTSIPSGLFSGVNGSAYGMFAGTFAGCPITSIPSGLFRKVTTAQDAMFAGTFAGCTDLGTNPSIAEPIPQNLFSTVTGGAAQLFRATFMGCSGLTHIPENLFSGVNVLAEKIFQGTFAQCTDLRSLPDSLFPNVTSFPPYASERSLFPFSAMFMGDSNLTGFVPQTLFANLSSANYRKGDMNGIFGGTNLKSDCAESGMVNDETPFRVDWYVKDDQYATTCRNNARITYHLNGGVNSALNPTGYTLDDLPVQLYKPTKAGETFLGWCMNGETPSDCVTFVNELPREIAEYGLENVDLYAVWVAADTTIECGHGYFASFGFDDNDNPTAECVECIEGYYCPGGLLSLHNAVSHYLFGTADGLNACGENEYSKPLSYDASACSACPSKTASQDSGNYDPHGYGIWHNGKKDMCGCDEGFIWNSTQGKCVYNSCPYNRTGTSIGDGRTMLMYNPNGGPATSANDLSGGLISLGTISIDNDQGETDCAAVWVVVNDATSVINSMMGGGGIPMGWEVEAIKHGIGAMLCKDDGAGTYVSDCTDIVKMCDLSDYGVFQTAFANGDLEQILYDRLGVDEHNPAFPGDKNLTVSSLKSGYITYTYAYTNSEVISSSCPDVPEDVVCPGTIDDDNNPFMNDAGQFVALPAEIVGDINGDGEITVEDCVAGYYFGSVWNIPEPVEPDETYEMIRTMKQLLGPAAVETESEDYDATKNLNSGAYADVVFCSYDSETGKYNTNCTEPMLMCNMADVLTPVEYSQSTGLVNTTSGVMALSAMIETTGIDVANPTWKEQLFAGRDGITLADVVIPANNACVRRCGVSYTYEPTTGECTLLPQQCSEGQYMKLTPATATVAQTLTCEPCESGYYCPGGTWAANEVDENNTAGRKDCPDGYKTSAARSTVITQCYATCPTGDNMPCITGANCSYSTTPAVKYYGDACPTTVTCQDGYLTTNVAQWAQTHTASMHARPICSLSGAGKITGCSEGLSYGQWQILMDDAPVSRSWGIMSCNSTEGQTSAPAARINGDAKFAPTVTGTYCWMKATHIDDMEVDSPWIYVEQYPDVTECANNCGNLNGNVYLPVMTAMITAFQDKTVCDPKKVNINWGGVDEPGEAAASCMYDSTLVLPVTAPVHPSDPEHYRFKGWKVGTPDDK